MICTGIDCFILSSVILRIKIIWEMFEVRWRRLLSVTGECKQVFTPRARDGDRDRSREPALSPSPDAEDGGVRQQQQQQQGRKQQQINSTLRVLLLVQVGSYNKHGRIKKFSFETWVCLQISIIATKRVNQHLSSACETMKMEGVEAYESKPCEQNGHGVSEKSLCKSCAVHFKLTIFRRKY